MRKYYPKNCVIKINELLLIQRREEGEWEQWVKEQNKKPAKIIVDKPVLNKKKNDIKTKSSSL